MVRSRRPPLTTEASDPLPLAVFAVDLAPAGEGVAAVHALLVRLWEQAPALLGHEPDATWRGEFATAVGEIAANIVRHACPSVADRCHARLSIRVDPDAIEALFTDLGVPFLAPLPSGPPPIPPDAPWEWPEGGLGLGLARVALDVLAYERTPGGENRWTLRKQLAAPAG